MKHFFLITNAYKDEGGRFAKELLSYIERCGGSGDIYLSDGEENNTRCVDAAAIPKETEALLVLGGDGTLIHAAHDTAERDIPLLGVNLGHTGFLCEPDRETVFEALDKLLAGDYLIEERMRLEGALRAAEGTMASAQDALNDIVIHRIGVLQMVHLIVYVNGAYLHAFDGDGVIISSPTGSTAYNLSAGGPIVDPKAKALLITPINAHQAAAKSIVLDASDEVTIEVGSRRREGDELVMVSFDGDRHEKMRVGDRLCVRRGTRDARILKLSDVSFLEILRRKLN